VPQRTRTVRSPADRERGIARRFSVLGHAPGDRLGLALTVVDPAERWLVGRRLEGGTSSITVYETFRVM
jgi:hypothetical protein